MFVCACVCARMCARVCLCVRMRMCARVCVQGIVNGVLLLTPNAVMFDPNVSDPLVKEHGPVAFSMITPLDSIARAVVYHSICAKGWGKDSRYYVD